MSVKQNPEDYATSGIDSGYIITIVPVFEKSSRTARMRDGEIKLLISHSNPFLHLPPLWTGRKYICGERFFSKKFQKGIDKTGKMVIIL